MSRTRQLLNDVRHAFSAEPRPEHFTNYTHCEECREHDDTLRQCTPDTIGKRELGNTGWDPICFITDGGYRHYLPGLARIVLETNGEYLDQFLHGLTLARVRKFTRSQRAAVGQFLVALDEKWAITQGDLPEAELMQEVFDRFRLEPPIHVSTRADAAVRNSFYQAFVLLPDGCPANLADAEVRLREALPKMEAGRGTDSVYASDGWEINAYLNDGVAYESGQIVTTFGADRADQVRLAAAPRRFEVRTDFDPMQARFMDYRTALRALASFEGAAPFDLDSGEFV